MENLSKVQALNVVNVLGLFKSSFRDALILNGLLTPQYGQIWSNMDQIWTFDTTIWPNMDQIWTIDTTIWPNMDY